MRLFFPFPPTGSLKRLQVLSLLMVTIWFAGVYTLTSHYARGLDKVPTAIQPWERNTPFMAWMIIPYFFSSYLFARVFFWCRTHTEVRTLRNRMLLVITIAGICFLLFPLRHALMKPPEVALPYRPFFWLLHQADSPFNQAPSLHVTFCVLHASVAHWRFRGLALWAVWCGLALIAISTVFVYQHHVLDVVTGLILGTVSLILIPKKSPEPSATQISV